ncbi:P-loop containing nucleoside triphosphate hydrolase protein [Xylariaceae sp. FL0255]|nr:P-loop containing nucleoside triphosphate hydrolase protein [Xylariaceae sp. FL0255]
MAADLTSKTPEEEWNDQKTRGAANVALDELMGMIGLDEVKSEFLRIKASIDLDNMYFGPQHERRSAAFIGNPGTGKTTVARIYSNFLSSLKVFGSGKTWTYRETSGSLLASGGIPKLERLIEQITDGGGVGAFFIDETYQLVNGNTGGGSSVLDALLAEMENLQDKIVSIFAGYADDMDKFFGHNPGVRSRVPYQIKIEDYDVDQILQLLISMIKKKYSGRMAIATCHTKREDPEFLLKLAARRISKGRNIKGFANARAAENMVSTMHHRLSSRLNREYSQHSSGLKAQNPNPFLMIEEDILGTVFSPKSQNAALKELQAMIGLRQVKRAVRAMITNMIINRWREVHDQPPMEESLNKVFLGNPGTGKTTVAKLYGLILVGLGLLSNGEVVVKNPADFTADVLGGSEKNTKAILEATKGKILVIDEAYMLGSRSGAKGTSGHKNPYMDTVIDTLVANVHSYAGDDRCVLLLGYKDKMEEMYQDANPGFKRRFPLESAFVFEDYSKDELRQIWKSKMKARGLRASAEVEELAMEMMETQRHKLNFGNAGEIDIILDAAQGNYRERIQDEESLYGLPVDLQLADVDPDFQRLARAAQDIDEFFKDIVSCEEVKGIVKKWPARIAQAKKSPDLNIADYIPMVFTFVGPPGTGKTTTGSQIRKLLYSLTLLSSSEVNTISASDLIGEFIGQTGPKVRLQFEKSLGKVLFIDEAYRLAETHSYGQEAINEIVNCLTEPKFKGHIFVIFAGYEDHIDYLLSRNPGFAGRIKQTLRFSPLKVSEATELLEKRLSGKSFTFRNLQISKSAAIAEKMGQLVQMSGWANGRSIGDLAKNIEAMALDQSGADPPYIIDKKMILAKLEDMAKQLKSGGRDGFPSVRALAAPQTPMAASDTLKQFVPPTVMKQSTQRSPQEPEISSSPSGQPQGPRLGSDLPPQSTETLSTDPKIVAKSNMDDAESRITKQRVQPKNEEAELVLASSKPLCQTIDSEIRITDPKGRCSKQAVNPDLIAGVEAATSLQRQTFTQSRTADHNLQAPVISGATWRRKRKRPAESQQGMPEKKARTETAEDENTKEEDPQEWKLGRVFVGQGIQIPARSQIVQSLWQIFQDGVQYLGQRGQAEREELALEEAEREKAEQEEIAHDKAAQEKEAENRAAKERAEKEKADEQKAALRRAKIGRLAEEKAKKAARLRAEEQKAREQVTLEQGARERAGQTVRRQKLSRCPQGYEWNLVGNGRYQCKGGSHSASAADLGL